MTATITSVAPGRAAYRDDGLEIVRWWDGEWNAEQVRLTRSRDVLKWRGERWPLAMSELVSVIPSEWASMWSPGQLETLATQHVPSVGWSILRETGTPRWLGLIPDRDDDPALRAGRSAYVEALLLPSLQARLVPLQQIVGDWLAYNFGWEQGPHRLLPSPNRLVEIDAYQASRWLLRDWARTRDPRVGALIQSQVRASLSLIQWHGGEGRVLGRMAVPLPYLPTSLGWISRAKAGILGASSGGGTLWLLAHAARHGYPPAVEAVRLMTAAALSVPPDKHDPIEWGLNAFLGYQPGPALSGWAEVARDGGCPELIPHIAAGVRVSTDLASEDGRSEAYWVLARGTPRLDASGMALKAHRMALGLLDAADVLVETDPKTADLAWDVAAKVMSLAISVDVPISGYEQWEGEIIPRLLEHRDTLELRATLAAWTENQASGLAYMASRSTDVNLEHWYGRGGDNRYGTCYAGRASIGAALI